MSTEQAPQGTSNSTSNSEASIEDRIVDRLTTNLREQIKAEVTQAFQASKRELSELTTEACSSSMTELTAKTAKAARLNENKLKKVGNQQQYKHNQNVLEEIEAAERALDKNEVAWAKEKLANGKSLINKKLKHIKLADREELGWSVVRYYESDELASDSEDEKSINRARREALASKKKKDLKKKDSKGATYRPRNQEYGGSTSLRRKKPLFCFSCNREGHTRNYCFALMDKNKK